MVLAACGPEKSDGADADVTTRGTVEVTARLADITGEFPSNDLYDYAYVMRYDIVTTHRGETPASILVGHYNPLKPRASAADARSGEIGGNIKVFRVGDTHRLALDVPIDDYCMAGIINPYAEETQEPIYWAVWANEVID